MRTQQPCLMDKGKLEEEIEEAEIDNANDLFEGMVEEANCGDVIADPLGAAMIG